MLNYSKGANQSGCHKPLWFTVDLESNVTYKGPQGNVVLRIFHLPTTMEDERVWK